MRPDQGDDRLRGELTAYHGSLLAQVEPAGSVAVRRAVRRRRRVAAALAGVGVLVVILPLARWAGSGHDDRSPTAAATTAPAATTVAPGPAVASLAPNAAITRADLLAATLDLPPWPDGTPCPAGPVRLVDPPGRPGEVILSTFAGGYGDVDSDGLAEPVVLLRCLRDSGEYPVQVLALDRNANGRIVVLGAVFRSDSAKSEQVYSLTVRPDGLVNVEVTDVLPASGEPGPEHRQWRGFRWDGQAFQQVDGPTGFPG